MSRYSFKTLLAAGLIVLLRIDSGLGFQQTKTIILRNSLASSNDRFRLHRKLSKKTEQRNFIPCTLRASTTTISSMEEEGEKIAKPPLPLVLWRFTRPHTIIGSALAIPALTLLAPMEVIVKHWNNSQHTFLVEPTFTIDTIKDMIVKKKKVPRNDQVLNFGNVPLDEDEYTLRDYNIKHKDVIQMVKAEHMRTPETRKKSYLPENWREEVEKKYGTVKTTTYRTNYSGENDDHFLQGKIREENTDFLFSEKTQQVLESPGKWVYED